MMNFLGNLGSIKNGSIINFRRIVEILMDLSMMLWGRRFLMMLHLVRKNKSINFLLSRKEKSIIDPTRRILWRNRTIVSMIRPSTNLYLTHLKRNKHQISHFQ